MAARTTAFDPAALPVTALAGIGPGMAQRLARLGVETVEDLLFHLPLRYEDRTAITALDAVLPGQSALVEAVVVESRLQRQPRPMLVARLHDGRGVLTVRFFHFAASLTRHWSTGTTLSVFGEVRQGNQGLEMIHPEFCRTDGGRSLREPHLTPVYPTTEGISAARLRLLVRAALTQALPRLTDHLPAPLTTGQIPLVEALRCLHAPPPGAVLAIARQRLAFEELLTHQAHLLRLRATVRRQHAEACGHTMLMTRFLASLPFAPTRAQQQAIAEISQDLAVDMPMQRLLQGDVGAGKTVVAAAAALQVIEAGHEVALMAPTELLARQHLATFQRWFAPLGVPVHAQLAAHSARRPAGARGGLFIGTHALFQKAVAFERLALIIIDEQHRFGVRERQALRDKGRPTMGVHMLAMSATPIPRTLAQSVYADLDVSVLGERPPGRTPVTTVAMPDDRRSEVITRLRAACAAGARAYWVCPLIDDAGADLTAAVAFHAELVDALPQIAVGLIHGRMRPADKERAMAAFVAGTTQVLVATTVIEVGVDVPEASLLVIENAERLGLAQLHQLRGRVGRGWVAGHCVLLYRSPLNAIARARLACLRETDDGFAIAERDLALRGAGEIFGDRQTGLPGFRIADLAIDAPLLPLVARAARALVATEGEGLTSLGRRWLRERAVLSGT